jgi:hypothetical protein
MPAYIKSGVMSKALLAPQAKPLCPEALKLDREADDLEAELEVLRTPSHGYGFRHLKGDEHSKAWELRKRISKLERQIRDLRRNSDPQWFNYWGV